MNRSILLVEDNEDDAFLMKRALLEAGVKDRIDTVEDGQAAIEFLNGSAQYADRAAFPLPAIVFLDLKLPHRSGHDVLAHVKENPALKELIVIVLTSSSEPVDLRKAYDLGANSYVVKPPTSKLLLALAESFKHWWIQQNRTPALVD